MAHIPPIYGVPVHILVQHNLGPNHCHVWIIHHLWLRAGKSSYRMNLKVLLPEMVIPAIFGWPFLPWNRYRCLTSGHSFARCFILTYALQVVQVHGVLGSSCHPGLATQSGSSIASQSSSWDRPLEEDDFLRFLDIVCTVMNLKSSFSQMISIPLNTINFI
jgi:hypothetical protein